ncbi:hypothetical protein [Mastigocoleus testarum]|uniref:Uncharacterized protein n=1 Tax=Mastigocoleus testarum BC008 TaxID=371196 RepID=A0A0V7ZG16_9CYAN|nr:hypothetical protein [Mastigocoleus testarum]KST63158.1 hypothetical protein BC008_12705 [Mastigocoleus testarum BC008]KST63197.1 hypothetical protein BC008_12890 [Mastigocoleus testarum BC008]
MRFWRFWLNAVILSSQHNPPRFVELLMLSLAIIMLAISTLFPGKEAFLILGLSFVVGASLSILVREVMSPSPRTLITQITAVLLLVVSIYGFADLIQHL